MATYQDSDQPADIDNADASDSAKTDTRPVGGTKPRTRRAPAAGRKRAVAADVMADAEWFTPRTSQSTGQVRIAEEFTARYQDAFMHVDRIGWHEWAGSHWKWVPEKRAYAAVQRLCQILLHEAVELEPKVRDQWLVDIRKCESSKGFAGVAAIASGMPGISVDPEHIDNQPDLIAFRNVTYDLRTDEVRPPEPGDRITKVMGCHYDQGAECPNYDSMTEDAQPDPEMRAYLHRQIGSALEGRVREHMFPVYCGPGGAGKGSTLNDSWLPTFGDYGMAMPVDVLLAGNKDYMTERLSLKGARYVVTSEPKANAKFNAGLLKLLAGGDKLSARPLYSNKTVQWDPTHQVFMMCNFRPDPPADDGGVWRRLKPVDWNNAVPEDRMDRGLPQKLNAELAGIANRLLAGWRDFRDNGIQVPDACKEAAREWRREVDILGQFLDERCVSDPGNTSMRARSSALFQLWTVFCHEANQEAGTNTAFTAAMKVKGYKTIRANGMHFLGVGVKELES
jgi:putative DNA primase/helicase